MCRRSVIAGRLLKFSSKTLSVSSLAKGSTCNDTIMFRRRSNFRTDTKMELGSGFICLKFESYSESIQSVKGLSGSHRIINVTVLFSKYIYFLWMSLDRCPSDDCLSVFGDQRSEPPIFLTQPLDGGCRSNTRNLHSIYSK